MIKTKEKPSKNSFIFDVNAFLKAPNAFSERFSFEGDIDFSEIPAISKLKGIAEIMRIEDGLNVVIKNVSVKAELKCEKCLKQYEGEISVPFAERHFLFVSPKKVEDEFDIFVVNMKSQEIDLSDLLRQELILHFPIIQVCSPGCKGICYKCKRDLSESDCDSDLLGEESEKHQNKPLSKLKDLLKS